jgi:hypothetical protein
MRSVHSHNTNKKCRYYQINITVPAGTGNYNPKHSSQLGSEVPVPTLELDGIAAPPVVIVDNVVVGVILSTALVVVPNKSVKLVIDVGFMLMTESCSTCFMIRRRMERN